MLITSMLQLLMSELIVSNLYKLSSLSNRNLTIFHCLLYIWLLLWICKGNNYSWHILLYVLDNVIIITNTSMPLHYINGKLKYIWWCLINIWISTWHFSCFYMLKMLLCPKEERTFVCGSQKQQQHLFLETLLPVFLQSTEHDVSYWWPETLVESSSSETSVHSE